jgi:hypothetical protein
MTGRIPGFGLAVLALVALMAGCGRATSGLLTQPAAAAAGDPAPGSPAEQLTRAVKAVIGKGFTFLRVTADELKTEEMFGVNLADPSNTTRLPEQVVSVQRRDDGHLTGTLDLTKGSAFGATQRDVALMGEAAKQVPFEAGIDSGGRLATLMYTLPRYALAPGFFAPAMEVSVAYADFDRPVKVAKPTVANYVNAPPALYRQLNPA